MAASPSHRDACLETAASLRSHSGRLVLEIERRSPDGVRKTIVAGFADAATLKRWLAEDALRFEQPLLHAQLREQADRLRG